MIATTKKLTGAAFRAVPLPWRRRILDALLETLDGHGASGTVSYSSSGQDIMLAHLLRPDYISGFYVDVGAWQPRVGSNTFGLYRRGWRGITIEPRHRSTSSFRRARPGDTHLEVGVGTTTGSSTYHVARSVNGPSSVNSFSRAHMEEIGADVVSEYTVQVERLDTILEHHLPAGTSVDLLAVDTEGRDLDVLESNDWQRFRPTIVLVEDSDGGPRRLLKELGYVMVAEVPVFRAIRDFLFIDPAAYESRGYYEIDLRG